MKPLSAAQLTSLGAQNGAFYEVSNLAIQDHDKLIPVIQKDTVLHIEGPASPDAPAAIVLYVPTRQMSGEGDIEAGNGHGHGHSNGNGKANGLSGGTGHE